MSDDAPLHDPTEEVRMAVRQDGTVHPQRYAFLVDENELDQIHGRILARGVH